MKELLPNIYEYTDFRRFLTDYQKARREFDPTFTASYICSRLGMPNTRSYFKDVINGKQVTKTFQERFVALLEFSKEEAQFFRVLVRFNQCENPDECELLFDQLVALNKRPVKQIGRKAYRYYKDWHNSAVRAVLNVWDFKDDYAALGRRICPPITARKARESIGLLRELGLIKKDCKGYYRPTDKIITTGSYADDAVIKQYQLQCLELAKRSLVKNRQQPQNISTNMISLSEEGYRRIERQIQRFKSEIRSIVHNDDSQADRVYQLGVLLFPGSKPSR